MLEWNQQKMQDYVQGKLPQAEIDAIELEYQVYPEYRRQLDDFLAQQEQEFEQEAEMALQQMDILGPTSEQSARIWQQIQQTLSTKCCAQPIRIHKDTPASRLYPGPIKSGSRVCAH